MNRKPGLFLILMITLFLTIGFQCDEGSYIAIRGVSKVEIFDLVANEVLQTPILTTTDSLALLISFELEQFASHDFSFDLMNEAWADCYEGICLANEIIDIRVFCDKSIYNLPAGSNLAGLLTYKIRDLMESLSLPEFLDNLPGLNEGYYFEVFEGFTLNFPSKPAADVYTFSIEIEDNNGHDFTATAPPVDWK
jgi:hypothetical protein